MHADAMGWGRRLAADARVGPVARGVQQQSPGRRRREEQHAVLRVRRALAALRRSDRVLFEQRDADHLPGLRAAVRLPLPEAAVPADPEARRGGRRAEVLRQGGPAAARGCRPGVDRRKRLRHPDQEGRDVRAAPGVREGRAGALPVPRDEAGRSRRSALAVGVPGAGDPRAGRRGLRLCDEAPGDDPDPGADLRHLHRVRGRAEAIRRADPRRGQEAARGHGPGRARQAVPRLPQVPARRRQRPRRPHAAHPHHRQVPAVEVLARDDVHRADPVGGRPVLRPARHGEERPDA